MAERTIAAGRRDHVLAIAGPTASGKSGAAVAIARATGAEIVSVDSALVYRGMDIGTAKPTLPERGGVPHYLIDIRDPADAYSAADFARDAATCVEAIHARGRIALLVGGTMLYFKAYFEGLDDLPPADAGVRAALEAEAARDGWPAMHAVLARVDPPTAARLAPGDRQRVQRALEVHRLTGVALSDWHKRPDATETVATEARISWASRLISLEPTSRGLLHERIAARFDAMLTAGFVDEVRGLRARGDLHADLPSMRAVGYRQAWEWLDENERAAGSVPLDALRERTLAATRQLAKRQLTWLRGWPGRRVVACDDPDVMTRMLLDDVVPSMRERSTA